AASPIPEIAEPDHTAAAAAGGETAAGTDPDDELTQPVALQQPGLVGAGAGAGGVGLVRDEPGESGVSGASGDHPELAEPSGRRPWGAAFALGLFLTGLALYWLPLSG